jgi:hypothetical protein
VKEIRLVVVSPLLPETIALARMAKSYRVFGVNKFSGTAYEVALTGKSTFSTKSAASLICN